MPAQELHSNRRNFCASQQSRIDSLWRFVQEQRAARRKVWPVACLLFKSYASHLLTSMQCEESSSCRERRTKGAILTDETPPLTAGAFCQGSAQRHDGL